MFPLLRFSYERGAYVLRFVGETRGPVLRKNRRRRQLGFPGPDRREGAVDPVLTSRPQGGVRRIEATDARRRGAQSAKATARPAPRGSDTTRGSDNGRGDDTPHGDAARRPTEGTNSNRRGRQHGRQRPPRPRH